MSNFLKHLVSKASERRVIKKKVSSFAVARRVNNTLSSADAVQSIADYIVKTYDEVAKLTAMTKVMSRDGINPAIVAVADPDGTLARTLKKFPSAKAVKGSISPKSKLVRAAIEELDEAVDSIQAEVQDFSKDLLAAASQFIKDFDQARQGLLVQLVEAANGLPAEYAEAALNISARVIPNAKLLAILDGLKAYSAVVFDEADEGLIASVLGLPVDQSPADGLNDAVAQTGLDVATLQQKRLAAKRGGTISVLFSEENVDSDNDSLEYVGYGEVWNPVEGTLDALGYGAVTQICDVIDSAKDLLSLAGHNTQTSSTYFENMNNVIAVLDKLAGAAGQDVVEDESAPVEEAPAEVVADATASEETEDVSDDLGDENTGATEEIEPEQTQDATDETPAPMEDTVNPPEETPAETSVDEIFASNVACLRQNIIEMITDRQRDLITFGKAALAAATAAIAVANIVTVKADVAETQSEAEVDTTAVAGSGAPAVTDTSEEITEDTAVEDLIPELDEDGNPIVQGQDVSSPDTSGNDYDEDPADVVEVDEDGDESDSDDADLDGEDAEEEEVDTDEVTDDDLDDEAVEDEAPVATERLTRSKRRYGL